MSAAAERCSQSERSADGVVPQFRETLAKQRQCIVVGEFLVDTPELEYENRNDALAEAPHALISKGLAAICRGAGDL